MTDRAWNWLIYTTSIVLLVIALSIALHGAKTFSPTQIIQQAGEQR